MEKGWEQIVAVLAIHLTGAGYIPIDAALPEERIRHILQASNAKAAIYQQEGPDFLKTVPFCYAIDPLANSPIPNQPPIGKQKTSDLAYVIFTSGSTGTPKGVMIEHQAAVNTIESICDKYAITSQDCAFAISSLSFDLSVFDLFGLLRQGGSIYIPTKEEVKDPSLWFKTLSTLPITVWNSAPALMQIFMDTVELQSTNKHLSLRLVMMSGDWIPVTLPQKIRHYCSADIVSLGGATEASIWSNDFFIPINQTFETSIPYGKPLPNQTMKILDSHLVPRPIWTTGMIYIGGKGLSRGYLNDPEKTNLSFVWDPMTKERLYKTGDFGRLGSDGNIEFLGREDLQVKIQGYRIELEEIEAVSRKLPEIQQVLARIIGKKHEAKKLLLFYTTKHPIEVSTIKEHLIENLPFYMIPNHFLELDAFPLNSNGKIDMKALTTLLQEHSSSEVRYEEPLGHQEIRLASIWKQLLQIEKVGRLDNFFLLGGTSFLAFQMIHLVQKEMEISFSLSTLFQKGTIAELLEQNQTENPSLVTLQAQGSNTPFFFIHPSGGGVLCYTELSQILGKDQPFYGLQAPGFMENRKPLSSIEELSELYLSLILEKQPFGPYKLGGWSFGGVISFVVGSRLKALGHEVFPLFMIDSPVPTPRSYLTKELIETWFVEDFQDQLNGLDKETITSLFAVFEANIRSLSTYTPQLEKIDLVLLKAEELLLNSLQTHPDHEEADWGWKRYTTGNIDLYKIPTDHNSLLKKPHVENVAKLLQHHLNNLQHS